MKLHRLRNNPNLVTLLGVVLVIILILIKVFPIQYHRAHDHYDGRYFYQESKLDSLNHAINAAKNRHDSLMQEKKQYVGGHLDYSGFITAIGIVSGGPENKSFIIFGNIGLKIYEQISKSYLSFRTINDQGYLVRMKFDKARDGAHVSLINKKVDYQYDLSKNAVMVPCKAKPLELLAYVLIILSVLLYAAIFLFSLSTFFKFLLAISKNKAFTMVNTKRLRDIAIAMSLLALSPVLLNILAYFLFIALFSSEGIAFNYSFWKFDVYFLIAAILSYVMYITFRHAMLLQQENELTI